MSWSVVAVVAVVLAVLAVRADRPRSQRPPDAAAVVPPAPTGPSWPAPVEQLTGVPGAGPTGVRLLLAGRQPGVLDVGADRFTPLHDALQMGGDAYVVLGRGAGFTAASVFFSPDEFGRASLLRDDGTRVLLGAVRQVLPMRDGTVLVVSCVPGSGTCVLSSRDRSGVARWWRAHPPEVSLLADTPYGVLTVVRHGDGFGALRLQDARSARVLRLLGRTQVVLAVSDRQVAFQELDCEPGCPVFVVRLADGVARAVPAPVGRLVTGAFSPDGTRLAVGVPGLGPDDPFPAAERAGYAVVVDLAKRRWVVVPGLRTGAEVTPLPVWTPAGDRLLVVAGIAGATRVASWRPGDRVLTILPTRLPDTVPQPGDATALP